ncbi:hypothetical protein PHYBOEH_003370 [Phytophthora boehmeriae]|uniref:Necrosis inducing-like protein NPP1 type n=1 Tax=Phytophthora boehmeriae TaxID=109152 RepID=A0A8T1WQZ8_9STRA|nr:hypothetical protein PHYBOEH_003370 [Phytophthora boehmeriae]
MHLRTIVVAAFTALFTLCDAASIDHDKVQPFSQPEPVIVSEKAAIKFKPQLSIEFGCVVFPAVNAAGETSGGLKGTGGNTGCKISFLGSQVYGRAAWYKDIWAIMYAWYFPKAFWGDLPKRRHDWKNVVVWIDNPAVETPKLLGISTSRSRGYLKTAPVPEAIGTTPMISIDSPLWFSDNYLRLTGDAGQFHDLIMWEQLTDAARAALNSTEFDKAKVPFIDDNFNENLEEAWPF